MDGIKFLIGLTLLAITGYFAWWAFTVHWALGLYFLVLAINVELNLTKKE